MMRKLGLFVLVVVGTFALTFSHVQTARANGLQAYMHLGRIWTTPENDGDESDAMLYPAGIAQNGKFGDATTQNFARGWLGVHKKGGSYLFVTDWTAPDSASTVWPDAGSYFFRSMNYGYPSTYLPDGNFDYLYPVSIQEYLRYPRSKLLVVVQGTAGSDSLVDFVFDPGPEGLDDFVYPSHGGVGPRPTPIVDPNLVTEEMIESVWRYIPGVELRRRTYGYPYGTLHQDYVIQDMRLWNNGISGRTPADHPPADADTLTGQTLTNLLWAKSMDLRDQGAPGAQSGQDQDAMYVLPWGDGGHHAFLNYDLDWPDVPGPDVGDPAEDPYYENLLLGSGYRLIGPLFTSTGPGSDYDTDDPSEPTFRTVWYERGFDMKGESPYTNQGDVLGQRELLADGSINLPDNTSYADFAATAAIAANSAGPTAVIGYGPLAGERTPANVRNHGWTLNWQDSVRIVSMWAAGAIDQEEGRRIGAAWNAAKLASLPENQWMSAADIALVQSGRDTAMKAAAMAYWSFNGHFAPNVTITKRMAWNIADVPATKPAQYSDPYDVPDAPRPPGFIAVRPVNRAGIEVRWGTESESSPDHDTGVNDFAGYRVYRQATSRVAPWEVIAEGPAEDFQQVAVDGSIPAGRAYVDVNVTPGQNYWYCVVAYDDGTQNWEQPGVSLESTRWATWTGFLQIGVTAPASVSVAARALPDRFALDQNVPNPFNPTTTIHFSVGQAAPTKLVVYSANGQVVKTLVDGAIGVGVHSVVWDGTDAGGRAVASGVYLYRLTSGNKQQIRRMVLLR